MSKKSFSIMKHLINFYGSQKELAKKLNVKQQTISYWLTKSISIKGAVKIEKLTKGEIKKQHIRPDIFL
ncbi:helix-turn-helix domain-containing protein [bacterium]|nr:helix-turn-helix domain-containing protein [bacterium]